MTAVAAYMAMVIACAALLCGHQGEGAPPGVRRAIRAARRHRPAWALGPARTRRYVRRLAPGRSR